MAKVNFNDQVKDHHDERKITSPLAERMYGLHTNSRHLNSNNHNTVSINQVHR